MFFQNYNKKREVILDFSLLVTGDDLLSRVVSNQVPSALKGLTSVFGMRTGGSPSPLSPEWLNVLLHTHNCTVKSFQVSFKALSHDLHIVSKDYEQAFDLLVSVNSTHYCAYIPDLSTL